MSSPSPSHNRRWLVFFALSPVVVVIVVLLAVVTKGPPEPAVSPVSVPAGYRAISDAYFGYSIPSAWKENNTYTDANGDFFYQGPSPAASGGQEHGGWVGENVRIRDRAPVAGANAPAQLATFGQAGTVPYRLGPPRPVTVPGITVAYDYAITRANGFHATAREVWEGSSRTEMWMLVKADPTTTATILSSVAGFRLPAPVRS